MAVAAKLDLKLWRINFVGAYLNSLTKEDIYMKQPEGFVEAGFEDYVAKLVHTIYRTMQGGHNWWETLDTTYNELNYMKSCADPCVRYKKEDDNYTLTDTYTNNIFGASKSNEEIKNRKGEIGKIWDIKDVGETVFYWYEGTTGSGVGDHTTYPTTILGTGTCLLSTRECHTQKHPAPSRNTT